MLYVIQNRAMLYKHQVMNIHKSLKEVLTWLYVPVRTGVYASSQPKQSYTMLVSHLSQEINKIKLIQYLK